MTATNLDDYIPNDHDHVASVAVAADLDVPSVKWDLIVQKMWDDYACICDERGLSWEDLSGGEGEEDYDEDDEDDEYSDDD